jgi:hypothetical protein
VEYGTVFRGEITELFLKIKVKNYKEITRTSKEYYRYIEFK